MKEFVNALDQTISAKNWYGALFIALSLPDICGKIDNASEKSQSRYANWFDQYVGLNYKSPVNETTFLSGNDCYALRCAFLHEGSAEISEQRAKEIVEKFHFIAPLPNGTVVHKNMIGSKLQLQVNIFCEDIKQGVLDWIEAINGDSTKSLAVIRLLHIQLPNSVGGILIS